MVRKWMLAGVLGLAAVLIVIIGGGVFAQNGDEFTYQGELEAPEFPEGLSWLNVSEPLTLEQLRGKIIILDFWTYGCINCMHIIPDLKTIETLYPNEVVVIGVHSAKFENEGVTENIRQIVQRYGVVHPVVNDKDFVIWRSYGARAWPSLYVIDPFGKVVGRHEGESVYEVLGPVVAVMVKEYGDAGVLDTTPVATIDPEISKISETPLLFPGKVLVDEAGERLFIADTGHNRIVVADLNNYDVLHIIGSGEPSLNDGSFSKAAFNSPQGMALVENILYVADTNNHAIRAVDLGTQTVSTAAGTGSIAVFYPEAGAALDTDLRSPWDVTYHDGVLYIAMAGSHQLWSLDLASNLASPYAGNAREDLIDGPRLDAELAQPSGLATDGNYVYFADSEASAIRRVEIAEEGQVETIIGPVTLPEGRLFEFGDVDGVFDEARLQHPLGVTLADEGTLYIADTYNNKIKAINVEEKSVQTFVGNAAGGYFDGAGEEALFDEPGGLDYSSGKLYVADTNNHAIRVIDVASGSVSTVIFPNVTVLLPEGTALTDEPLSNEPITTIENPFADETLMLEPQTVAPGEGTITMNITMPIGYKLNSQAPFTVIWPEDGVVTLPDDQLEYRQIVPDLPIVFPVTFTEGETQLSVDVTIYWCEAIKETLCFVDRGTVIMPITVSADAQGSNVELAYNLVPPDVENNTFGN